MPRIKHIQIRNNALWFIYRYFIRISRESVPHRASWLVWILTSVCAIARIPHRLENGVSRPSWNRNVRACMQIYIELSVLQLAEIQHRESPLSSLSLFLSFPPFLSQRINLIRRHSQYSKYLICFCSLCLSMRRLARCSRQYECQRAVIFAWDSREYSGKNTEISNNVSCNEFLVSFFA